MASSSEEQQTREPEPSKEMAHKTKLIQFLGRTTPVILQNDNGPCPLLAICNVLLLKNQLNLSPDIPEVSQEKLLSLVAERLIDSNSNVNNKDAGYVENQQQNIADAIDLLPRLATGIDVNIKFRRIQDFEFTRECAIFDLLDIPLYHGWIVDPQDYDTVNAIGSKSYNTLMGELVALETQHTENEQKKPEEDCVDFAAATTATLGVPSPCLSRGISFDDSPRSTSDHHKLRKGDVEEEAELLRVLKLTEVEMPVSADDTLAVDTDAKNLFVSSTESAYSNKSEPVVLVKTLEGNIDCRRQEFSQRELSLADDTNAFGKYNSDMITFETASGEGVCSPSKTDQGNSNGQSKCEEPGEHVICKDVAQQPCSDPLIDNESGPLDSSVKDASSVRESHMHCSGGEVQVQNQSTTLADTHKEGIDTSGYDIVDSSCLSTLVVESHSSSDRRQSTGVPEAFNSSVDGSEPIYEGEECILESGAATYEDREPVYEGEVVLAKQVDTGSADVFDANSNDEITPQQGELIRNFLRNSASQLTIYGLFCLQDGLKERELCVFFRNNHFNTMFKFEGDLYILATDQGYINQPDLVWEKLNEVNGDTLYMTGNFKEFKIENHADNPWDEQSALANTADYLASIDNSTQGHSSFNSDLQLAIALQQQEFEQQPQRNVQQPTVGNDSRLVTGPQVPRPSSKTSTSSSRQEPKSSKEKCNVM
ncbi:unnamed protein product [Ilex paraguariensis]|uniref:MINDY deubiquitinase domain-containing protein n=1 Tax=Ilex paraguariensis TaxID=185542 RepID=A0ABC8V5Z4_9AQUA